MAVRGKRAGQVATGRQTAAVGRRMARGGTESAVGEVQRPRQHRIPGYRFQLACGKRTWKL